MSLKKFNMPLLIINQTTDKTFSFTVKNKVFTLEPGSKNIIDTEICPAEIRKFRATGELFVNPVTENTVEFYKSLATKPSEEKEVPAEDAKEEAKSPKKTKTNEKES